jgi:serine phosphatase RsbU (regulator of sigma subunit)
MIGDVCGHGPDEAALGVELRIAWRALTLAGLCGDELLSTLQQVLEHERESEEIFATLCTVDITPDGRRAGLCLAGHPAPLITRHGRAAQLLPYEDGGPALGLLPHARWPRRQVELGGSWSLMMYTDGLIEGRVGPTGTQRLGQEGMVAMINRQLAEGLSGEALLEAAVAEVRELNGGELTDDVAVLLLDRDRSTDRSRNGGRGRSASLPRPRPGSASPVSVQRPPL